MFGIGTPELVIILVVAVIVIGPNKLPGMARAVRKGMREFRKAMYAAEDDAEDETEKGADQPQAGKSEDIDSDNGDAA